MELARQQLGPPPAPWLRTEPSAADLAFFDHNGYLVGKQLTTLEELEWLRRAFEAVASYADIAVAANDPSRAAGFRQYAFPEITFSALLDTTFRRNARRYAAALLRQHEEDLSAWGQFIYKPPLDGAATPWHQDEAYWDPEREYHAVAAWLPLHDVTVERSCMQFVAGSHRSGEIHLHDRTTDERKGRQLEVEGADRLNAVACPLSAGGATFHHHRTLHCTGPNTTTEPRIAFVLEFQLPPKRRAHAPQRPWFEHRAIGARSMYVADGRVVPLPP
jgi:hypothetical protein